LGDIEEENVLHIRFVREFMYIGVRGFEVEPTKVISLN
jgi:hypothetical protein